MSEKPPRGHQGCSPYCPRSVFTTPVLCLYTPAISAKTLKRLRGLQVEALKLIAFDAQFDELDSICKALKTLDTLNGNLAITTAPWPCCSNCLMLPMNTPPPLW
ncbi:hypothetical protein [Undibacterium sp. Tian12W]|uniref:hypothetical protein n=1 Tax=Undibacterium sp. Tian12W TaxID=3413054 RepID=UPI003BEF71AC